MLYVDKDVWALNFYFGPGETMDHPKQGVF